MYALSQRPLSVIYSDSESFADIAARSLFRMNCSTKDLDVCNRRVRDGEAVIRIMVLTAYHGDHVLKQPSDERQPSRLRCSMHMQHVCHDCVEGIHLDQCYGLISASDQTTVRDCRRYRLAG
jgi:hypothetical protein